MKASVNMSTQLIISWFRKVQEELDSSSESVSNTNIVFSAQIRAVLVVSNVRYLYVSFVFVCNLIWAGFKGKKKCDATYFCAAVRIFRRSLQSFSVIHLDMLPIFFFLL